MEKELLQMSNDYWIGFIHILPRLALALVVILITVFIGRKISGLVKKRITKRLNDPLLANFIGRITNWIISLIGIIATMEIIGLANFAGGLIAGAGVSAIIIGFAFKDIGENFLSGLILAFNRPFNIGDIIETEDITGSIISLDLRTTTIKTFEGYDVFVPNSMIVNNPLKNYNREGTRRFDFTVGIDYDADVNRARELILNELKLIEEILKDPAPFVIVSELTSNSTNLKIYFWVNALIAGRNLLEIKSEVIEFTVRAFK
ncbi:MAG: mechanosensitive ion channel family protein, partial [Bacteroidota bacterium]|nr:mechanosensitive ion channel family protein [Bacteroidota bacterium]